MSFTRPRRRSTENRTDGEIVRSSSRRTNGLESGFDYGTDEKGISPRAGGGKVAWFKDPDGNIFSIEGDR
jgi:hypothetical protein